MVGIIIVQFGLAIIVRVAEHFFDHGFTGIRVRIGGSLTTE